MAERVQQLFQWKDDKKIDQEHCRGIARVIKKSHISLPNS